jgi:putative two-component system response regulator
VLLIENWERDMSSLPSLLRPVHSSTIVIADDDAASRALLHDILELEGYTVIATEDGRAALEAARDRAVDLAILDVMMPGATGFAVCRDLKSDSRTRLLPVVLVTGLSSPSDRVLGIDVGADDFITKPFHREELIARVRSLIRMKEYVDELEEAEGIVCALAMSIEAKDPYTEGHCQRLAQYATSMGKRIGATEEQMTALRRGGVLHDIGKVAVPEQILCKAGPLTPEERLTVNQHPLVGVQICAPLRSFEAVLPIIRHHHERLDGSGYPDGLKNGKIPISARILAVADVYDALTTARPYHHAVSSQEALETLWDGVKRGLWDGELVREMEKIALQPMPTRKSDAN